MTAEEATELVAKCQDCCPHGRWDPTEKITYCTLKPAGDSGFLPCVHQGGCAVWMVLVAMEKRGYENGMAYERICQQERMREQ